MVVEFVFNIAKKMLLNKELDIDSEQISVMLIQGDNVIDPTRTNLTGLSECTASGYSRKDLENMVLITDNNGNKVKIDTGNVFWNAFITNAPVTGALYYLNKGTDDLSIPLAYTDRGYPVEMKGGRFEIDIEIFLVLQDSKENETIEILSHPQLNNDQKIATLNVLYGV